MFSDDDDDDSCIDILLIEALLPDLTKTLLAAGFPLLVGADLQIATTVDETQNGTAAIDPQSVLP